MNAIFELFGVSTTPHPRVARMKNRNDCRNALIELFESCSHDQKFSQADVKLYLIRRRRFYVDFKSVLHQLLVECYAVKLDHFYAFKLPADIETLAPFSEDEKANLRTYLQEQDGEGVTFTSIKHRMLASGRKRVLNEMRKMLVNGELLQYANSKIYLA